MGNLSGSELGYNGFNPHPEPVQKPRTQLYLEPVHRHTTIFQVRIIWRNENVLDGDGDEAPDRFMESGQHSEATAPAQVER